jgi:small subunit ribosomal protein S16
MLTSIAQRASSSSSNKGIPGRGPEEEIMAVRIRLTRVGATKQPTYRVIVADSRSARDSRSIETIGHYNPRAEPVEVNIDEDRARQWLANGARPSNTVARLFRTAGILPAVKQ